MKVVNKLLPIHQQRGAEIAAKGGHISVNQQSSATPILMDRARKTAELFYKHNNNETAKEAPTNLTEASLVYGNINIARTKTSQVSTR